MLPDRWTARAIPRLMVTAAVLASAFGLPAAHATRPARRSMEVYLMRHAFFVAHLVFSVPLAAGAVPYAVVDLGTLGDRER
jgi:hypothetical protein